MMVDGDFDGCDDDDGNDDGSGDDEGYDDNCDNNDGDDDYDCVYLFERIKGLSNQ